MKEPTQRQWEVLTFIAQYIDTHTFPPTIREIGSYFGISVKGAYDHVVALKKKGYLTYEERRSRTMEILKFEKTRDSKDFVKIPRLGVVAAGQPSIAEENWDGFVTLHRSMLKKSGDYFALTVRGDSMDGAGIMDGDTAIVEKRETLRNGEIAVVQLEDKVTLKRFFWENNQVRLQPENPNYSPIYCSEDLQILGRLVTLIRSY
jgi:repressor LexA